jgi:hypothetical protein
MCTAENAMHIAPACMHWMWSPSVWCGMVQLQWPSKLVPTLWEAQDMALPLYHKSTSVAYRRFLWIFVHILQQHP